MNRTVILDAHGIKILKDGNGPKCGLGRSFSLEFLCSNPYVSKRAGPIEERAIHSSQQERMMTNYVNSFRRTMRIGLLCIVILFSIQPLRSQENVSLKPFAYLIDLTSDAWRFIGEAPFNIVSFSGDLAKGVIVFGGFENRQAAFLKDIVAGKWEVLVDTPFPVNLSAGDNQYGPLVCGGENNRRIAYMRDYEANVWNETAPAPFIVTDLAGDNSTGPIIVGGANRNKVAIMRDYSRNQWHILADAPFEIARAAGDNVRGILIAGGKNNREVAVMRDYGENTWRKIAEAPFSVIDIAGNNLRGPAVFGGTDNRSVAYMNDYRENRWKVAAGAPISASEISGSNDTGIILCKIDQNRRLMQPDSSGLRTVGETVLKTAVVEFTERGELSMQDAGAIIAEWLTTALNKTGAFEVYERLSLATLMEEHKLGMTGMMDEETAAEIGRIRGVEAIVTGSVSKLGDIYSVTAKVIDVETAKIINSSDIKVTNVNAIVSEIDKLAWELAGT